MISEIIVAVLAFAGTLVGCGVGNAEGAAAYANRASMIDVRYALLDGSRLAVWAEHASTITANQATADNTTGVNVAASSEGSIVNCQGITIDGSAASAILFKVVKGGTLVASNAAVTNLGAGTTLYSDAANTVSAAGIIYA